MEVILHVLGGLGLFLFAINNLSDTLRGLLGDNAKKWIGYFTKNFFAAILTGCIATIILDSSSAVIIMTIVLVNAKTLSLRESIGVVLGANIGTTFSSQLIAMDIGQFSPIPIFLGLVLSFFSKSKRLSDTARVILFFGVMFFGLFTMERAVEPLRSNERFLNWISGLENPLKGTAIGAFVTLVVQSSSATVGMVITLAKKGLISLPAGIAVMLGAELGTCSDTLLATIRSNRQAVKTGVFHLFFNMVCICLGLMVFPLFVSLIRNITANTSINQQIATAHILFNVAGVLLFMPFASSLEKLLNNLIPDKQESIDQAGDRNKEDQKYLINISK